MWLLAHKFLLLYVRMNMYRGPETTKGHKIEQKEFKRERLRRIAEGRQVMTVEAENTGGGRD